MADETKVEIKDIAEAPAKAVETVIDAAAETAKAEPKAAKAAKPAPRRAKRKPAAAPKAAKRRAKAPRKIKAARKTAAATKERTITMKTTNPFNGFDAIPAFAPFQSMFAQFGERGEDMAKKSQKVAEELVDLTRANVEAIVEAGKVAVEGARTLGQDMVATGRDGVEQASDAIRSLAEAKSPTEYMQLQGEFARASFDRMVADGSKLTESMVKLAGEAFQPLQNRASANAERFNTLVA
ncbi:MAG: phasin family protein [Sphingomicrobium sp.]